MIETGDKVTLDNLAWYRWYLATRGHKPMHIPAAGTVLTVGKQHIDTQGKHRSNVSDPKTGLTWWTLTEHLTKVELPLT